MQDHKKNEIYWSSRHNQLVESVPTDRSQIELVYTPPEVVRIAREIMREIYQHEAETNGNATDEQPVRDHEKALAH